ncbi:MAG: hypothetical protein EP320_15415 [Rhodobacteraceae bacterium]|jgi:hypothetical protein|uniref:Uncharacterized protein n=1 Tax=Thioclava marina TaxID=1915077 RepID=A0ABX3MIH9_9RHOB|nr:MULTISPECIES: hypothetical protein [Thioclava]OOY11018.1 hypothetical protein BMG00_14830 [Thioclava marina]OOY27208.1 hypothetical protein BMI90_14005 [Thioclava sp. L04-15]TNE92068.1 MAG: hypothetical protein EP337_05755 [Paracoccaceae bacterium]TNF11215.1 MAG: hypothetical protein EP320_15415 [Paracoccaceae bacterium]
MKHLALIAALGVAALPALSPQSVFAGQPLSQLEIQRIHELVGDVDLSNLSARQIAVIKSVLVQRTDEADKKATILAILKER